MLTDKTEQLFNRRVKGGVNSNALGEILCHIEKLLPDIDIAELETLAHAHASCYGFLNVIPYGIGHLDLNGRIKYANTTFHKIFGYAAGELVGQEIFALAADKKEISRLKNFIRSANKGQNLAMPFEAKRRTKDGGVIDVRIHWDYSRDYDGKIDGILGAVSDITAEKKTQLNKEYSDRIFRAITENSSDMLLILDETAHIRYASPAIKNILGFTPGEFLHTSFLAHLPDEYSEQVETDIAQLKTKT